MRLWGNWVIVLAVWLTAVLCWRWMRKNEPEGAWLYAVYALVICAAFTIFAAARISAR